MKKVIFDRKNVLVTGGAGFIGSHLCEELVKTCKVICVDNFITSTENNIDHLLINPNFVFIKHDMVKPIEFNKLPELQKFKIEFQGIQEIYNLACPTSPINFKKNRYNTLLANSIGVKNALDLAVKYKAKFMQFSSSVVYGPRRKNNLKIKENDLGSVNIIGPSSSYNEGKRFAESFVTNYRDIFNIDTKIIRLFRVYGPRMQLNDGQMIPDFISNALENKNLVILGDENFTTSICYVSDVIDATLKIMNLDISEPINIGSDISINITNLAQKIINLTKSKSKISYSKSILFMTPLCVPDLTKASSLLGWLPIVTLENGLKKTIHDLMANKGLLSITQ